MIILTIRTDKPEAEVGLYDSDQQLVYEKWQAHRQLSETIHHKITSVLKQAGKKLNAIEGIVVFQGPGSFTGLRIGISVANTLSYALAIPIVAQKGQQWIATGIERLQGGDSDQLAMPDYGAPVHITKPRK